MNLPNSTTAKKKSIAIMQPYFFPYLPYFQLIKAVDEFVIYDDVSYINKGFINRNFILLNGQPHRITLSLFKASQNKLINEIKIADNAQQLLKTIGLAYKKAPFFSETFSILNDIFMYAEKNVAKFIGYSLQIMANFLEINTKILYSSEIKKDNTLAAQDKIIDICKRLETSTYVNAIGGKDIYDKSSFEKYNLDLFFIQSRSDPYQQFQHAFVPNLSIIDTLMFNEKQHVMNMLEQYALI